MSPLLIVFAHRSGAIELTWVHAITLPFGDSKKARVMRNAVDASHLTIMQDDEMDEVDVCALRSEAHHHTLWRM